MLNRAEEVKLSQHNESMFEFRVRETYSFNIRQYLKYDYLHTTIVFSNQSDFTFLYSNKM